MSEGDGLEAAVRLAEALVFASAEPVSAAAVARLLPPSLEAEPVLRAVQANYAGRGVELVEVAGGWQFRTALDLAGRLTQVVQQPRRLARAAMDALLEAGLIEPKGRKEAPGRPTLWGTTAGFLTQFGLQSLRDLPPRAELDRVDVPLEQAGAVDGVGGPAAPDLR